MLEVVQSICSALGSATPPRTHEGAVGSFWTLPVPHSRLAIAALLAYARDGHFRFQGLSGVLNGNATILGQPTPTAESLDLSISLLWHPDRAPILRTINLPYPTPEIAALCQGERAAFSRLAISAPPRELLPKLSFLELDQKTTLRMTWNTPWMVEWLGTGWLRLFRRWTKFRLLGLELTATEGRLMVAGPANLILPSLIWT